MAQILGAQTYLDIVKSERQDDGSLRILGRPTREEEDIDGQIADKAWAKEALPEWFKWSNIREMHTASAVGTGQSLEFDANDDPWVQATIVDPDAVKKVEAGVYKGLSIGIKDPVIQRDVKAPNGRIVGGKIIEISLVDRPAVASAKFELVKRVGANEWLDTQSGFVLTKTNPTDGTALNPDDFDPDGNPIDQPGHLKVDVPEEPTIISQTANQVTVKVGDKVYQVPIDMDGQGNVVVGAAEEVPGILPAEGTTLAPEHAAPPSTQKGAHTMAHTMETTGTSFEHLQALGEHAMDGHHLGEDHYHHTEATYPDRVIVGCGWGREGQLHAVPVRYDADGAHADTPYPVEARYTAADAKAARGALTKAAQVLGKAVWSTAYIDALPDSAFAATSPGGTKADRHLPYRDADGQIDPAHVRNALARLDQTGISDEAKAKARRTLVAAAKEVGIDVEETKQAEAAVTKAAAMAVAQSRKVLCQTCKKSVSLTSKAAEAHVLGGGFKVSAIADCGHTVHAFVKEDLVKAASADRQHCPTCDKAVEIKEHRAGHVDCEGMCGHAVKCSLGKGVEEDDKPAIPQDNTDPNRAGGDDNDPETAAMDAALEKKFAQWAQKMGLTKAAESDIGTGDATRAKRIADLRDLHRKLGDRIEEYAAEDLADKEEDHLHGDPAEVGKAALEAAGGPARPKFNNPKEVVKELKGHLRDMLRLVEEGDEEMGHTGPLGDPNGHLTEDGSGEAPGRKPKGDGRINFTQGDMKTVLADITKAVSAKQAEATKAVMPDMAKAVADAVKGVLDPLAQRLAQVEHMAKPSPLLMAAEQHYALNPENTKAASATQSVKDEMAKLSPKARDQVLAAAIAKDRGWQ